MANLKSNDINDLSLWNVKELRKLRMTIKNRLKELESSSKPRAFKEGHPLYNLGPDECSELLSKVQNAEKVVNK